MRHKEEREECLIFYVQRQRIVSYVERESELITSRKVWLFLPTRPKINT
jgi:hypothetical protein